MTTTTDTNRAITADVDAFALITADESLRPLCDIGHPDGTNAPGRTPEPCQRPAYWTLTYHECDTPTDPENKSREALWCDKHLRKIVDNWRRYLAFYKRVRCVCGAEFTSLEDTIWNVRRIDR